MSNARIDLGAVPAAVLELAAQVRSAGGAVWLVGGTVRDLLLGLPPADFDLATNLLPERVQRAIAGADAQDARFGTCRVATAAGDVTIATLRVEGTYADRRRPDAVQFVDDPHLDARRRDFTVNGLYCDVSDGSVLDPVGGLRDLEHRQLRTIGAPLQRLQEDALRLLRLWRFAVRCDLRIEADTAAAARACAQDLQCLSRERTYDELTRTFVGPGRGTALRLLVDLGLAAVVLPEVAAMHGVTQPPQYHPEGDVLTHVGLVLGHVDPGDPVLAWSAVLHDVGKPPTWRQAEDRIRFDGHDVLSARMAKVILERLGAPRQLQERVSEICRDHIRFASLPAMRPRRREAWLRSPGFPQHLAFHRADCLGSHGDLSIHAFAQAELQALPPLPAAFVTGQDVLDLGVAPGPKVGEFLRLVNASAEEAPMPMDRAAALILLREIVERRRQEDVPGAR